MWHSLILGWHSSYVLLSRQRLTSQKFIFYMVVYSFPLIVALVWVQISVKQICFKQSEISASVIMFSGLKKKSSFVNIFHSWYEFDLCVSLLMQRSGWDMDWSQVDNLVFAEGVWRLNQSFTVILWFNEQVEVLAQIVSRGRKLQLLQRRLICCCKRTIILFALAFFLYFSWHN